MGDGNNFYNMDDAYIEQKYVLAEERRQQEEEARNRQREADQARALAEAEKQRLAAEAERARKKAEEDERKALEERQGRLDKIAAIRKQRQADFEASKKEIQEEREANSARQRELTAELDTLATNMAEEEGRLNKELAEILEQKRAIQQKEDRAREELSNYKVEMDMKRNTALAGLKQIDDKFKELQAQNTKLLQEHLAFVDMNEEQVLKKDAEQNPPPQQQAPLNPNPYTPGAAGLAPSMGYPNSTNPSSNQPQPQPGFYGQPGQPQPYPTHTQPHRQPAFHQPGYPQPSAPMQPGWQQPTNHQPQPTQQPSWQQPTQPQPSQPIWGTTGSSANANPPAQQKSKDDLQERLGTLDDLLRQGVLSKDEYDANKKEALRAAGLPVDSTGNPELDKQLAQLEEFKRSGALSQSDFESAKKKILEDAKKNPPQSQPQPSGSGGGFSTGGTTQVAVVVPPNRNPGDSLRITYQGKNYDVVIPPGLRPGQQFHAAIPV